MKRSLEEGTQLVEKRIKAIKLVDKSEYGWLTVNEYLSDELASDSEDEKRIYCSERRAEKKVKEKQRAKKGSRFTAARSVSNTNSSSSTYGTAPRFSPRKGGVWAMHVLS